MAVPYTFSSATSAIPLSQLDSNFATTITLGNTAIQLGNTVTTLNNMTLANVTVTTVSGASANAVVYTNSSGQVTANSSVIALDTSGNLGLGVTPSAWGASYKVNQVLNAGFIGYANRAYVSANWYDNGSGDKYIASDYATRYIQLNGQHRWDNASSGTAGNAITFTQAMTLDSSGNLLVGTTSGGGYRFEVHKASATPQYVNRTTNTGGLIDFAYNGSTVGSISTDGTNTTYGTSSDYRLKNDIRPMTGALAKVTALKPVTYKWNADNSNGEGFIAHELAEVCPQAVVGEKDAVNEDGSIKPQGIDTSFLVATLTAAIQELKEEVDSLKAQIAGA